MESTGHEIPEVTIETLSRSFYKEASRYGFGQIDYVRFVNCLLDLSMQNGTSVAAVEGVREEGAEQSERHDPGEPATLGLPLKSDRVAVRSFDATQDLTLFDAWLANETGRHFLLSRTTSQQLDIRDVAGSPDSILGVITLPDSTAIGSVAFLEYDRAQGKAELRKLIGDPAQRGKGYAKEASRLWIRFGLEALGLRKIYLNTLDTNIRNIRLNEDLGFRVEGVLRNEVMIDGTYHDVLRMGLWAD